MDIIDSRGVIARISYLEDEVESLYESAKADDTELTRESFLDDCEEFKELDSLRALAKEASGSPYWTRTYGGTLIRDSYFETYARELAEDIGAVKADASWPNNFIDWEAAADALKQDYRMVDFVGEEYWIRA
jgi:hypothetical protein